MEEYKILPLLLFLLFSPLIDPGKEISPVDEYAKFRIEPTYIANPTAEREDYFAAYDKALAHWEVDYEELYVETSKGTAHIVTSGPKDGIPIVLLHGMSASSTMWYPNAKALSKEYRLFAIDLLIEPGKSYKKVDLKNIGEIKEWYQEVINTLKLGSYHLIGTSRGGWLATDLALHDKNVRSVILLSPVQTLMWMPVSSGLLKNLLNIFHPKEKRALRTMETLSNDPSKINEDYIDQYRLALKNDSLRKFMGRMKPFSKRKLHSLEMPILVLIGDDDLFNTKVAVRKAEKHILHGEAEVISDSGHFLSIDQTELVNKKMLDFLIRVDKKDQSFPEPI